MDTGTHPRRPWLYRAVKKARPSLDRLIARYSEIPDRPILDAHNFPFIHGLRENWLMIRREAEAILQISTATARAAPDHRNAARTVRPIAMGQSTFLHGYDLLTVGNLDRCPVTARLIAAIPDLNSARLAVLPPFTHVPAHRGVTKGLITTHLGLIVPTGSGCRMRIGNRIVRWRHGETLTFDDTVEHECWNDTPEPRLVLRLQTRRQLRFPGRAIADAVLWGLRRNTA